MNEAALKKLEIINELAEVPKERLKEVDSFIKSILSQYKGKKTKREKEPKTLSGIWKGLGFEKIVDLDQEITSLRRELGNQIFQKTL
jgi:hypothetical protein